MREVAREADRWDAARRAGQSQRAVGSGEAKCALPIAVKARVELAVERTAYHHPADPRRSGFAAERRRYPSRRHRQRAAYIAADDLEYQLAVAVEGWIERTVRAIACKGCAFICSCAAN